MPKYFFSGDVFKRDEKIHVTGGTAHHLLRVLRYKPGQPAVFCDGQGTDFHCVYEGTDTKKENLIFEIIDEISCFNELPYNVTLYQAVIASEKLNLAIQKSVELGVRKIVPVITHNSRANISSLKAPRLQKIAENAAEQSMRGYVPEVAPVASFDDWAYTKKRGKLWLVAYEKEKTNTILNIVNIFSSKKGNPQEIGIWIGPEGGFVGGEITALENIGAQIFTLGRRILRAETAGPAALVQLQCALGAELL